MTKMIFVSLPVADVAKATAFYEAIGMVRDPMFSGDHASAMEWSDAIRVMLLNKAFFSTLTNKRIVDAHEATSVLLALSRDSRAEVDEITEAALAAGGRQLHEPEDEGFMYSRAFEDLDGHGWGPVYMDMTAATETMGKADAEA